MIEGHVFIATSQDGFIARKDGSLDWLTGVSVTGEDHGYNAFIDSVDGIVMGRGTFDVVTAFDPWPYSRPVIVMSRTLRQEDLSDDLKNRVEITDETPQSIMARLARRGWTRAYIDGGQVIQSFLAAGLIAEMSLFRMPVLIGEGRPLFGSLEKDLRLDLVEATSFPSGIVKTRYKLR